MTAINLRSQEVGPRLFVGIVGGTASNLRSLRRHPARPVVVAVATRAAYAAIGDLDRQAVAKIHPVRGGHRPGRGHLAGRAIAGDRHGRLLGLRARPSGACRALGPLG